MRLSAAQVAHYKCEQYEIQDRSKPSSIKPQYKNASHKWQSCQYMICGEFLDMLTTPHAQRHNYKTTDEIIKAGYIRFLGGK